MALENKGGIRSLGDAHLVHQGQSPPIEIRGVLRIAKISVNKLTIFVAL